MSEKEKKLTPKQNSIIYCLQNGWELITSSDSNIIHCCTKSHQFEFSLTLFYNLLNKGLIYQGNWEQSRFGYILTKKGREIKTKKVTF